MNGDYPSPNRPLLTVVYSGSVFYSSAIKPPVNLL
ncbi:hypothetical protein [Enterobacter hormaechei]